MGGTRTGALVAVLVIGGLTGVVPAMSNTLSGEIRGNVTMRPSCPGPAPLSGKEPCAPQPVQTTVKIFAASDGRGAPIEDAPLKVVSTDQQGAFRVTLAPGAYRLVPVPAHGALTSKPRDIAVTAGSTISIELSVDSGLR
jgi:hypothetical protein